ncbi:FAD binding domain-containing protein [Mycobacterium sp. 21AC1]|uniref:FAD binding domain-containing protein n=1 Tax=[Mycobacterium] appelbergii TaxID=2939269 RepID=UPI002938E126|nr:FAD binding domain-containing protein [Mycobacterium sp. 21AC1]MDV3128417.1 FAD binding domain-containing protein [Mycobacterium sp. 21AC1]
MSTFRVTLPRNEHDIADSLARIVAGGGEPVVIGGGTLTVPALARGDIDAPEVVDLGRTGLNGLVVENGSLHLGALVCYQQLLESAEVRLRFPLLHRLCAGITGGVQIRNQGTIIGALCAARPQSDIPAALVALAAEVVVKSTAGTRTVSASAFLHDAEKTGLAPTEFVSAVRISTQPGRSGYVKVKASESSWPVVTAAAIVPGRVVLGGVSRIPHRIPLTENMFDSNYDGVRAAVTDQLDRLPVAQRWSDLRADWTYRRRIAPEVAVRAVRTALERRDTDCE